MVKNLPRLIDKYRAREGNEVGGNLHIVLDDYNVSDGHIRFVIEQANEKLDYLGVLIGTLLLEIPSEEERERICREAMERDRKRNGWAG